MPNPLSGPLFRNTTMRPSSPSPALRAALLGTCLALQGAGPTAAADRTTALCTSVQMAPLVEVPVGKSTVLRLTTPVTRILLGNPENARAGRPADQPERRKDEGVKAPPMDNRPGVAEVDVLLLAPTRGLVAVARRRARQKWEFAQAMLAVEWWPNSPQA